MAMVGYGFNIIIDIGIEMLSSLSVVNATWYYMPEVGYYTCTDQQLTFCIIINSPRIAKAMCNHFKAVLHRMISPDATIDIHAFSLKQIFGESFFMFI